MITEEDENEAFKKILGTDDMAVVNRYRGRYDVRTDPKPAYDAPSKNLTPALPRCTEKVAHPAMAVSQTAQPKAVGEKTESKYKAVLDGVCGDDIVKYQLGEVRALKSSVEALRRENVTLKVRVSILEDCIGRGMPASGTERKAGGDGMGDGIIGLGVGKRMRAEDR